MYSIEEFDKQKTKILKYIMYKKRTENEIRIKFNTIDEDLLEDSIEYLKEAGYINDKEYIERSVTEFKSLKNMSIKEVIYSMLSLSPKVTGVTPLASILSRAMSLSSSTPTMVA